MNALGFCSLSALDRPLAAVAEAAAGAGLDGVEVTARAPHLNPDAGPAAARAALRAVRDAGLNVLAYGSYLGTAEHMDPALAAREVALAAALDTPLLRVWAESEALEPVVALLRSACDAAARHGIHVVVERHRGSWAETPERIARLFAAVERPNLALNYQVLDFLRPEEADSQAKDAAGLVPRARYFHLKNYRLGPEPDVRLVHGGSLAGGALDYTAILGSALGAGYAGPLTIEFLSFEAGSLEDKLAADVAFVRRVLAARDAG